MQLVDSITTEKLKKLVRLLLTLMSTRRLAKEPSIKKARGIWFIFSFQEKFLVVITLEDMVVMVAKPLDMNALQ